MDKKERMKVWEEQNRWKRERMNIKFCLESSIMIWVKFEALFFFFIFFFYIFSFSKKILSDFTSVECTLSAGFEAIIDVFVFMPSFSRNFSLSSRGCWSLCLEVWMEPSLAGTFDCSPTEAMTTILSWTFSVPGTKFLNFPKGTPEGLIKIYLLI